MGRAAWVALVVVVLVTMSVVQQVDARGTSWWGVRGVPMTWNSLLRHRLHRPAGGPEHDSPLPTTDHGGKNNWLCVECQVAAAVLMEEVAAGMSLDALIQEGIVACVAAGTTLTYCQGYMPMIMPIIHNIILTHEVTPADACGMLLSAQGCTTTDPDREWTVVLQGEKPPVVPVTPPESDAPRMKVLHLADPHVDPLYVAGSNADCPEPLCCREDSGTPQNKSAEAWYWGDYRNCGTPPWMFEDLLLHAATTHPDIDYVIWTGDVVPHNMWSTSQEFNTEVVRQVCEMIRLAFPNVPIFPVVGNHEMSPLDQFTEPGQAPQEVSADWVYELLAEQWSHLVPDLDNSTVKRAAYYSVLLRPGFRLISFNSMFGYVNNVWLVANSRDPASELTWLEGELNKAEAAGELVHLLGHVPPGIIEVERRWSREYNRIIVRYENIIRGQFFGHTHYDEFEIFHDGDRPINVAYIAPSQTPWYDLNPAYRVYHIDGDRPDSTRTVVDHQTYIMNLTEAQVTGVARWYQLYNARDHYTMEGLQPTHWQHLAERMTVDRSLFDLYYTNFVSAGDPYLQVGCDDQCYQQRLCDMVTSDRNNLDHCNTLLQRNKSFK